MPRADSRPRHSLPVRALVALALLAGCGGSGNVSNAGPGSADQQRPLELEPILWARSEVPYRSFRAEALRALHEELESSLGEPLLFRVVPFVRPATESEPAVLVGETLEIYYQETKGSVYAVRRRVDRIARDVQSAFPDLGEKDHVLIHVRLPEGKTVADLDRRLHSDCGSRNALRADILPSRYVPGKLDQLEFELCDGPNELDARLQDPSWPLIEDNWSTAAWSP